MRISYPYLRLYLRNVYPRRDFRLVPVYVSLFYFEPDYAPPAAYTSNVFRKAAVGLDRLRLRENELKIPRLIEGAGELS